MLIDAQSLTKIYDARTVVDGVSLAVPAGEVVGLMGPNGAGKTTTLRMLAGFLVPTSGTVSIDGHAAGSMKARELTGYLAEGAPLYGEMAVESFLDFVARARGAGDVGAALGALQLGSVKRRTIEDLSKGYKRRVALAAAIIHRPPVLLLDEPTDGLDPNQRAEVEALIRELAPGRAIVISTHNADEVEAMAHRVVIIDGGRIVADGAPAVIGAGGGLLQAFRALTMGAAA